MFRGFFFFQAEDGIRDLTVTGVQTCALPISLYAKKPRDAVMRTYLMAAAYLILSGLRSEERRVGKECRCRWAPDHEKKKRETSHYVHGSYSCLSVVGAEILDPGKIDARG